MVHPMGSIPRPEVAGVTDILYVRHWPVFFRRVYRVLRNVQDARDVIQEAFYKVLKQLAAGGWASFGADIDENALRDPDSPSSRRMMGCLHVIVVRTALDVWRGRVAEALWLEGKAPRLIAGDTKTPEELALLHEEEGRVFELLSLLPPRQAQALFLRLDGYSYGEIARVLEIELGAVGHLIGRACANCRKLYAEVFGSELGSVAPRPVPTAA